MNIISLFIQNAYAACDPKNPSADCPATLIGGTYNVESVFGYVVTAIAGAAALAFFVMIVIAGLKLVFAQGDSKKVSSASGTITWAFLGIIFVVLAWLILNLIGTFTGHDFTVFKVGTGR